MKQPAILNSLIFCIVAAMMSGCNDRDQTTDLPPSQNKQPTWRTSNGNSVVNAPDEHEDPELADAIKQARATAEAARSKWNTASADDREQWWVKWAAPTADGHVEHVWVQPVNWSPFRIEGTLASDPIAELVSGKGAGEIVSFSIDEISDWMRLLHGSTLQDFNKQYEGGYTVRVLESRFGRP